MPDTIRTVHINTERTFRGGEQQVLFLMQGLVERGHEAALIAQPDGELARRAADAGIAVHKIRMRCELDPIGVALICAKLRELGSDIVHMHTGHAHTLGVAASLLSGCGRRVVSRRVVSKVGSGWLSRLKYRHGVHRYIAISGAVRNVLLEAGVSPDRVSVVNSCVDLSRLGNAPDRTAEFRAEFGIPEGALVVGSVGALCRPKGFDIFVEAASRVSAQMPGTRFLLVGDGELRGELERRSAELGVNGLTFTGWREDVPELLRFLDVFVSSSVEEGLGTSAMQALAAGAPAVVTDAGGLPEVVDGGRAGLIVPASDSHALADAVVRLLGDGGPRARLVQAGRSFAAERFGPARMVEETIAAYCAVLGR